MARGADFETSMFFSVDMEASVDDTGDNSVEATWSNCCDSVSSSSLFFSSFIYFIGLSIFATVENRFPVEDDILVVEEDDLGVVSLPNAEEQNFSCPQ